MAAQRDGHADRFAAAVAMIVTDPQEFLAAYSAQRYPASMPATARAAFAVAPDGFSLAAESAGDNRYMEMGQTTDAGRALAEHAALVAAMRQVLPVTVFPGDASTPDAVFPNNVFGTAPGRFIIGAMRHAVRRREAQRGDVRAWFIEHLGYETVDLSTMPHVAELTGSLVIDRARGVGFCGLSERCDTQGARAMHEAFGLKLTFTFDLAPGEYHTNVVLALLASRAAIIAPDGFADPQAAEAIMQVYAPQLVVLSSAQKAEYAGNAITLSDNGVWMSARAAAALQAGQRDDLTRWGFTIHTVELDEIEKAGGSLRCCVGEIY